MCEQKASHLANHSELGSKILNQICLKIIQKLTKIAITTCKCSKFFRGSMPPDPLKPFLFLNQLQISSAKKKIYIYIYLKKCENYAPSLLKFLATPLPKCHFRGIILNILVKCLKKSLHLAYGNYTAFVCNIS